VNNGLIAYIKNNLSLGNRLSEFFYGVMMVAVITGLINSGLPPTQSTLRLLLVAGLAVNLTWGIIDGVTAMYGGLVNRADYYRIANAFREDRNNPKKRENVRKSLQGTIIENLGEEEQSDVVEMIGAGEPVTGQKFPATRADWNVAIATILIDFILVFPVIVPYFLIDTVRWAVFASHTIAIVLIAGVAALWARNLGLNTKKAGIIIAVISFAAIYFTYLIGW
jgi:VIT1/CCC1 family predicted Fe2+/Mn2+ transporter